MMPAGYRLPNVYGLVDRLFFEAETHSPLCALARDAMDIDTLPRRATVLDLACGTGTVALWIAAQRPDLHVFGVDLARDMIDEARAEARRQGLSNTTFICRSVFDLSAGDLRRPGAEPTDDVSALDMVVCSYGFSAIPQHAKAFSVTLELLAEGGRYVIMDVHYARAGLRARLLAATLDRRIWGSDQLKASWRVMAESLDDFEKRDQPFRLYGIVPAVFFTARGSRPTR